MEITRRGAIALAGIQLRAHAAPTGASDRPVTQEEALAICEENPALVYVVLPRGIEWGDEVARILGGSGEDIAATSKALKLALINRLFAVQGALMMFDQANALEPISTLTSRFKMLGQAMDDLRQALA